MALTTDAIRTMYHMSASSDNPSFTPTVQVIHLKQIEQKSGHDERWKVILSDGQHFFSGMCATQLNKLVHSGVVSQNAIISVKDFIVNTMGSGQKICILLNTDTAAPNPGQRIGSPTDIQKAGTSGTPHVSGATIRAEPMYSNVKPTNIYSSNQGGRAYGGGHTSASNPYGSGGNRFEPTRTGHVSSAPIVRTSASGQPITPISGLNMYSNKWVIRAKVTNKSQIRTWSNARGEGSLFSVSLLDSSGVDVRATFFKEAVDKFYSFLEEDRVYTFSGGRLKVANMQYNTCKSQFEITFDQNSEIHLDNDAGDIRESYDFVKIANLESTDPGAYVDILCVVKNVGEVGHIVSKKTGKELMKCELLLEDDSGADVKLTVWGDTAQNAHARFSNQPVVAFKRARVSDYGGRSLSGSSFNINPQIPQTNQLKSWWTMNGNKMSSRSLSSAGGSRGQDAFDQRKTVSSIKDDNMGYNEKPDWLSFKATITFLKKEKAGEAGAWYTACANSGDPCRNMFKATPTSDGAYYCEKCQQTYPTCVRRWIFSGTISDDTSTSWVSIFNEQAEALFNGVTADDLYKKCFESDQDPDLYNSVFAKAAFTEWVFKCKVKQELVGDESRVKTSLVNAFPVDYVKESRELLRALNV